MSDSRTDPQQFLACLSDPSRFRLVTRLAEGGRCVTELAMDVGLSQSCTTRHLQALQRQGIVRGIRQGKRVVFQICSSESGLHPVLGWALSHAPPTAPIPTRATVAEAPTPVPMAAHEDGWVSDLPAESVPIVEEPFSPTPARDLEDFLL
jgi:DNA-binding transcriptional ArsR family regulator